VAENRVEEKEVETTIEIDEVEIEVVALVTLQSDGEHDIHEVTGPDGTDYLKRLSDSQWQGIVNQAVESTIW